MIVPLADQADEVEREVRARQRIYPDWIARGRLKAETAEQKLRDITAAAATLRLFVQHANGLRELIRFLRSADLAAGETPGAEETAWLLAHPAVREVLATFPEAALTGITPAAAPSSASAASTPTDQPEQGELP